ncbi:hypothetical protein ACIB15232_0448 [Aliarcobacter cibarius]|uniref:hypothetical protein n=1 Tax=Aliarcobacter cibarius TaxID=255507 RepID=UPI001247E71B|nr:hypothetical protein [Aliarcobacter cibarius]QEZ88619.1 hypothetical protein ACIB15232_0448 [Aliarcobacter cibarius]
MKSRFWIKIVLGSFFTVIISVCIINYIVDPYGIYNTNFFKNKPFSDLQMRIVKAVNTEEIKPASIILGTSRAEIAINPNHKYFLQPAYNLAVSGSTLYESKLFLKNAIKSGKLEQVLLVADWRMFNEEKMRKVPDIDNYFDPFFKYAYLLNFKTLKNSYATIKNKDGREQHYYNGQMDNFFLTEYINISGGHLKVMNNDEKTYYEKFTKNNTYKDTKKSSLDDFRDILEMCYENNIKLDVVFGPSHIRQWESFDYHLGIDSFYDWKKSVVNIVDDISKKYSRPPFKIVDFSIYHPLTAEEVPTDPSVKMEYHFEGSHYKEKLANIMLDRLSGSSNYNDFGVELTSKNIDTHIEKLKSDRVKFIDTKKYRKEVFGEN